MARLLPSDVAAAALAGAHPGEIRSLKHLAKGLSDDYSIFHSVHWSKAGKKRTDFGEIDFAIVNRSGDVLFIEQKDGMLDESTGELAKKYWNRNQPKTLASQIQRNIGNLRTKFRDHNPGVDGLEPEYLIHCPGHTVVNVNAPGIDMERVVDEASKDSLADRVKELLGPGIDADGRVRTVEHFFAQTFKIAVDVSSYVSTQDRVYTQMLEGLSHVIGRLDFSPFRLRIVGTAGCGKSQLTLRFCESQLEQDKRPVALCYNRPFADKVAALAPKGVMVDTYHGFCKKMLDTLDDQPVSMKEVDQPGFWQVLQEQLVGVDIPEEAMFDALVVDEGQDFRQEWWDILQLFIKEDAAVLWMEDPLQNLREVEPVELTGFVTYQEEGSFRTPASIATVIREALEVEFVERNELPGLGVRVEAYESANDQFKLVAHRVNELKKKGFTDDNIVIVSCRGMGSATFSEAETIGPHAIRRFTGKYTSDGKQIYTDGKLYFDTIYRFKGQQAPAVILVDIDESLTDSDKAKRVLYCGMTRASVRLEMVVQKSNPWLPKLEKAA